jgi:hypothetical protein
LWPDARPDAHIHPAASTLMEGHGQLVAFIWSVADLLRGDYRSTCGSMWRCDSWGPCRTSAFRTLCKWFCPTLSWLRSTG